MKSCDAEAKLNRYRAALENLLDSVYIPDPNCSCHVNQPCYDCVEYSALREAAAEARELLALPEKENV